MYFSKMKWSHVQKSLNVYSVDNELVQSVKSAENHGVKNNRFPQIFQSMTLEVTFRLECFVFS